MSPLTKWDSIIDEQRRIAEIERLSDFGILECSASNNIGLEWIGLEWIGLELIGFFDNPSHSERLVLLNSAVWVHI